MDYLDYVQMTKGQQIAYNIKSFFTGIPNAIKMIFVYIGYFFKSVFSFIVNGVKGYANRFTQGDGATKLSYIVMGAGNMAHKQIGKGLVFLATEIAYIAFMINFGWTYIDKAYSNGIKVDPNNPNIVVDGAIGNNPQYKAPNAVGILTVANKDTADNSSRVLLFFVLTLMVTVAFFAVYIASTKSAFAAQQTLQEGKQPMTFIEELNTFLDERYHITMLCLPVLLLLVFNVLPIIFTIFIAFTNYGKDDDEKLTDGIQVLYHWTGFDNFADVFYKNQNTSSTFGRILVWTLIWAVFATFTNYIFGIVLALLINKKEIKFKGFWRTMFVVTAAVPQFVTLLVMKLLLDKQGVFNSFLGALGFPIGEGIPFLTDQNNVWLPRFAVIVVNMWIGIPFTMLITSGLLMNIPEDLYESARIDGANAFQQFTKITFPYIFFVTTPYLITTFVSNINNFNVIYFLTNGGPTTPDYANGAGATDLLVTWLYKLTVTEQDYKLAAVIGIIVFILCAGGSLITFNMSKAAKNEEEFS